MRCALGSVLVTRPERAGRGRRGKASRARGAHARSRHAQSLTGTDAADYETEPLTYLVGPAELSLPELAADEPGAGEDFGVGDAFRVSDYLVLSNYSVAGEELAASDEFADDVVAVCGDSVALDPAGALGAGRLAPLLAVDWAADTLPLWRSSVWPRPLTQLASAPRSSGPARHRRPRPAREKTLAQVAAAVIAVVMAGAGIGLGLHVSGGGGHAAMVAPVGLAAGIFPGTAPPAIARPHIATRARARHRPSCGARCGCRAWPAGFRSWVPLSSLGCAGAASWRVSVRVSRSLLSAGRQAQAP